MAASAIMTIIVLAVLSVTTNILNTWNRASGELKNKFDATVVGNILQDDFESVMIKRDGRAWFQVDYPDNVGVLSGSNYLDATPLKPPEIMFFSSTVLRPRYTRDQISTANQGDDTRSKQAVPIPGSVCAIKYQLAIKSPFMKSSSDSSANLTQYNAFFGLYRAVIDPPLDRSRSHGRHRSGIHKRPQFRKLQIRAVGQPVAEIVHDYRRTGA